MASPQFAAVLQAMFSRKHPWESTNREVHDNWEARSKLILLPADVATEAVDADGLSAEWVSVPESDPTRVLLYFHGGGFVIGSLNTHREVVQRLCRASGARCLNVDYRLAPQNRFPSAVDDATRAYRWLVAQGIEPRSIVIAGDSAGGGLVIAVMVALRDAGDPLPGAAVALSPWVDLEMSGESMVTKADVDPIIQKSWLLECAANYLGNGDRRAALVSPLYADLTGLPPLLIQVGENETLLDDATRLADRAKAAGVIVTLEIWDEMVHLWHHLAPMVPEGQQAIERIGEWVREKTASATTVA
jgi:acetyl esterase/lipase